MIVRRPEPIKGEILSREDLNKLHADNDKTDPDRDDSRDDTDDDDRAGVADDAKRSNR